MKRLIVLTFRLKPLFVAIILGVSVSLATGLFTRSEITIPEVRHYGYPLCWRETDLNGPTKYILSNLTIDTAFWVTVSFIALTVLENIVARSGFIFSREKLLLPLALAIPLTFVTILIHECGHALCGTTAGGTLTHMQIACLIIYPRLAINWKHFQLGFVNFDGLTTDFAYGFMLLGGSIVTNIASWLIGLILLKKSFGNKTQVAIRFLGFLSIFDLPFYVLFPQIGLRHWIFLGGCTPEPLVGARKVGIPDAAFYSIVVLSTLGLLLLYFKPLREKFWQVTTIFRDMKATFDIKLKHLCGATVCGVIVSLAAGLVENPPEANIGATYYGYPLAWRVTLTTIEGTTDFKLVNLAIDALFWITFFLIASVAIRLIGSQLYSRAKRRIRPEPKIQSIHSTAYLVGRDGKVHDESVNKISILNDLLQLNIDN